MSFFWVGHFEFFFRKKKFFFCFIPMKISPNLYGRMDGSKFWCFPWFPENSLLCVILCYTVYAFCGPNKGSENEKCQTSAELSRFPMQTVNRVSIKKYTLYYWRSWNLIINFSWLQISQKANKFFRRISVLASKMVQIKKKNISYQILPSWFLGDFKTRKFANEISWPLKDHHQHHFLIV